MAEDAICESCDHLESECECCGDCGKHLLECVCDEEEGCGLCGSSECEGGCDTSKGSMGRSKKPGWIKRGHNIKGITRDTNWSEVWPEIDIHYDPVLGAAEFYTLEAIVADVANGVPGRPVKPLVPNTRERDHELLKRMGVTKKPERDKRIAERDKVIAERRTVDPEYDLGWICGEAQVRLEEVVEIADRSLVPYFHMACAGEARHHVAIGGQVLAGPSNRDAAWTGWRKIYEAVGPEAIKDLEALLLEIGGGSYGGPLWATAASVLHQRVTGELGPTDEICKRLFVDRAFTLEHNGGCFLNKIGWGVKNRKGWGLNELKTKILEAHASDPPNYRILASACSEDVLELFNRYWEAANARREALGLEPVDNPYLNVAKRIMCRFCNSNPAVGHHINCSAPQAEDFNGGEIKVGSSWVSEIEEDEWKNYSWSMWKKTSHMVGPDGSIKLPADSRTVVRFELVINSEGRGIKHYSRKKIVSLQDAFNMEFVPKSFGKSQGALGEIKSYEWWMEIHVRLADGTIYRLAATSDKFYGKEYGLPNTHPYYKTQKEVTGWKSKPISVGEIISAEQPKLELTDPKPDGEPSSVNDAASMTYVLSSTKTKVTVG